MKGNLTFLLFIIDYEKQKTTFVAVFGIYKNLAEDPSPSRWGMNAFFCQLKNSNRRS